MRGPLIRWPQLAVAVALALHGGANDHHSSRPHGKMHSISSTLFSPCTFPPYTDLEDSGGDGTEFHRLCRTNRHFPFICDMHDALMGRRGLHAISSSYYRHRHLLEENGSPLFGIVVVRQLAQPTSASFITRTSEEFECLFDLPCHQMDVMSAEQYTRNFKAFTKLTAAALFARWFREEKRKDECIKARVLALLVLDGLYANPKKLSSLILYTGDAGDMLMRRSLENRFLTPYISNIQLEGTNALLQGVPLPEVVADLIEQLGRAIREFHVTKGVPRQFPVPAWAWAVSATSVLAVSVALTAEWLIVRRSMIKKRLTRDDMPAGDSTRSQTHMMF